MSADRVRRLIKAYQHKEAEQLLTLLLQESPNDPELAAELGILYCYTQREFEAIELLDRTAKSDKGEALRQILVDYFHCRSLMAQKLGVADEKGKVAQARLPGTPSKDAGVTLSACLIVKNEEAHLERCLASVQGVCDEIVVVDTGSTDRTLEIAKKFGARIGHFDWCDDFSAARNVSLDLATGHWALWIDADEELTPESHNAIREALIRPHFGGYFLKIVNLMDDDGDANQYVHTPVRLFRRIPEIRFEGRIHEQVLQAFEQYGLLAATLANATLKHYGYRPAVMAEKDKLARTVSMLEREVKEHPRDAFHWFNLANAYSVGRRPADAEVAARLCINFVPEGAPYTPVAYQILTSALIAQDRPDEALQECEVASMKGVLTVINEFDRAHALFKLDRLEEALKSIETCLEMPWPSDLTGDFGIKTYKGSVLKSQILTRLGRASEGLALADSALATDPNFGIGIYARACALEKLGRHREAAEGFLHASSHPGLEGCSRLAARQFARAGDHERAGTLFEALLLRHKDAEAGAGYIHALEAIGDPTRLLHGYESLANLKLVGPAMLVNWGRTLADVGQADEALAKFEEAASADPGYANAHLNAGDLLYSFGHYADAAQKYEQALRSDPLNPQAWFVLGNCFARIGHSEGAELAYRQTLAINANHREARANLDVVASVAA